MEKYRIQITWDEEDQIFIARVPELEGVATHGKNRIEATKNAEVAIKLHLKTLAEMNEPIPQPFAEKNLSGNMSLRMGKDRHEAAAIRALKSGASINEYINTLIDKEDEPAPKLDHDTVVKLLWQYLKDNNLIHDGSKKKQLRSQIEVGMLNRVATTAPRRKSR